MMKEGHVLIHNKRFSQCAYLPDLCCHEYQEQNIIFIHGQNKLMCCDVHHTNFNKIQLQLCVPGLFKQPMIILNSLLRLGQQAKVHLLC